MRFGRLIRSYETETQKQEPHPFQVDRDHEQEVSGQPYDLRWAMLSLPLCICCIWGDAHNVGYTQGDYSKTEPLRFRGIFDQPRDMVVFLTKEKWQREAQLVLQLES